MSSQPCPPPSSLAAAAPAPAGGVRVLVVEDDRELRAAVTDVLRLEGFEVAEAENGLDALLCLRSAAALPDVLVLDLVMPVMTGWELRQAQLADPALAGIPVVLLSSRPAEGLPADAVLPKPCPPEALVATVLRVARRA